MKLVVLLSTWNGSRYLRQQLDSILAQTFDGEMEVLIRDDGSTDGTVDLIKATNDQRIRLIQGRNLGAKGSFMALIEEARRGDGDYFAFADQDDYWLPDKLQRAVSQLRHADGPALYCSAMNLVDASLQPIALYRFADTIGFGPAFLTNCATGCTCVINRSLLDLLAEQPDTSQILMHDWWLYLVAVSFGEVLYDNEPRILYRQHAANQIGMKIGIGDLVVRTRRFLKRSSIPSRFSQAREFERIYGDRLPPGKQQYLANLLSCEKSVAARIRLFPAVRPQRHSLREEIFSSMAFLLGR